MTTSKTTTQKNTLPAAAPVNNYSDLYNAYEQAMNNRANAYSTVSNAEASDAARQLQIVGNQGKSSLYGTQGLRGQGVSETSLLQNQMATGTAQSGVKSAYDSAIRDVSMEKDQNLANTNRVLGNQQVNYENSLQDLMTQYGRDVDDLESSIAHNDKITDIQERGEYETQKRDIYEMYGTDYNTIEAYNKAINRLANDGKNKSDWKIQYLTEKRDALQAEIDEKKLAEAKNSFSKNLGKYKSTTQIDKAIASILSDGDTSNDWKLPYLNKYRTILNRQEVAARKAAKAASKKSGSDSNNNNNNNNNNSNNNTTELNQKARAKAKSDLKGNIATDVTNVWNPYYFLAGVNKK